MSCIVYQVDKKTGVKYAYESVSYWDKEKQQPRSKREYIGRVDPETGEIIPKKEKRVHSGDKSADQNVELSGLYEQIKEKDQIISDLGKELKQLRTEHQKALDTIAKIQSAITVGGF